MDVGFYPVACCLEFLELYAIEYQIARIDVVKLFFHNLRYSKRTQIFFLVVVVILILQFLSLRYRDYGTLTSTDFVVALSIGLGVLLIIPALMYLSAKTQKRALLIAPSGIETTIGSQHGEISWRAIDNISVTPSMIYITGKNMNAFTIPSSAFKNLQQRQKFIQLATEYFADAKQ